MLRNCTAERYAVNKSRMIPIAEYSRDCLRALRAEIGIKYDERSQGTLQLFRKQKQLDGTGDDIAVLKQYGVPYEVLDPRRLHRAPSRRSPTVKDKFVGGLRLPQDETGDCHMFTQALAKEAAKLGVQFKFNTGIDRWSRTATGSPASSPAPGCCRPMPMSRRSAAGRRDCSSRSAFRFRSIR